MGEQDRGKKAKQISASPCDAVVTFPVLTLPHDHHLAEDPRQRALRLHLLEVQPHRLGPGEGRRAGGAALGDRQGGDDSIRSLNSNKGRSVILN